MEENGFDVSEGAHPRPMLDEWTVTVDVPGWVLAYFQGQAANLEVEDFTEIMRNTLEQHVRGRARAALIDTLAEGDDDELLAAAAAATVARATVLGWEEGNADGFASHMGHVAEKCAANEVQRHIAKSARAQAEPPPF